MSTDPICTCSHGLGVLRHADDCPVAVERRRPVALGAPPEPVQDQPRVWELPTIPEDVKAVLDRYGKEWVRDPDASASNMEWRRGYVRWSTGALFERYSPLTEVVNTDGD